MHRLAATPGGWDNSTEGVVFIEQTPAPIVLLTAADTDISALNQALFQLPKTFSPIRCVNLLQLQQQLTIDTYAEAVLCHAQLVILRLLGGRAYWSYGLEVVKETLAQTGATLVVIPGDDRPDLDLMSHSTVPLAIVNQLWQYFNEGGVNNVRNGLLYISDRTFKTQYHPPSPQSIPKVGIYALSEDNYAQIAGYFNNDSKKRISPSLRSAKGFALKQNSVLASTENSEQFYTVDTSFKALRKNRLNEQILQASLKNEAYSEEISLQKEISLSDDLSDSCQRVGILFYRAHYLAGNTKVIDALAFALRRCGLLPVPIYVSSLKEAVIQREVFQYCQFGGESDENQPIELLINTTSFAIASLQKRVNQPNEKNSSSPSQDFNLWQTINVPVLQAICSGSPLAHWQNHPQGLTPRDIAMNVALPEVDGRIITRAVSFKAAKQGLAANGLQTDVVSYEPKGDRITFVANLAAQWLKLKQTAPKDRKIALILANYPNRDGRMANGVGLDTPASCLEILQALQAQGYTVGALPKTGDELMHKLASGITNDPEGYGLRPVHQTLGEQAYQTFFEALPATVQQGVVQRWGRVNDEWRRFSSALPGEASEPNSSALPIAGVQFGNVFVGIQPSRGYDIDPSLNYHAPDLEPTHAYLGFYYWLRDRFKANAVVHVGKHGNLEWLPGKGIALSDECYPEAAFGPMPHFYPFIVNDPGEGAQAKRRSQAVILDHLTPPMTRAELYGPLQQLENLVDEYYEAQNLDPTRLPLIAEKIMALLESTQLQQDLNLSPLTGRQLQPAVRSNGSDDLQTWLPQIDGYLCELKEAQIRDGLHVYGQCPQGRQLRDLIVAISRHPSSGHVGILRAIAQ
ncbi:MAG: cobaltochelatase subunit CobN, partial [Phormidesmis sp.]